MSPLLPELENEGISIQSLDFSAENLDWLIYSAAVPPTDPQRTEAKKRGIKQSSYAEALGQVIANRPLIAVAGTHGKTTTLGLAHQMLKTAGQEPTTLGGSFYTALQGKNFGIGTTQWTLVEACEFARNFQQLKPKIVLLTNIEFDHPDTFADEKEYQDAFLEFLRPAQQVFFPQSEVESLAPLLSKISAEKIACPSYEGELEIFGEKNRVNAGLVAELGSCWQISAEKIAAGLKAYHGTSRRQELLGTWGHCQIWSDYAHHPTEITATWEAFLRQFPERRFGVVFQPHQFGRTATLLAEFQAALAPISPLALWPIYASRDRKEDEINGSLEKLSAQLPQARICLDKESLAQWKESQSVTDLIFMSAGSLDAVARALVD